MRISPLCPSCLLSRVYYEAKLVTNDEKLIARCVDDALKMLASEFMKRPVNAHLATRIHKRIYEILQNRDPYAEVKRRANWIAAQSLLEIRNLVDKYSAKYGKFRAAVIASIVGNNFDYGVAGHKVVESDIVRYFTEKMREGLKIDDCDEIEKLCYGKVVYLTDNAGEIFFDRILMEIIKKRCEKLSIVVRGKPIISDATLEDAKLAGIDRIADEVLTNGGGVIGIIVEELPEETLERIENADILIAKGMANYESLSDRNSFEFDPVAFLLTAKCKPVARDIGVNMGDMVAKLDRKNEGEGA